MALSPLNENSAISKADVNWKETIHIKNALSGTFQLCDKWKLLQCGLRAEHLAAEVSQRPEFAFQGKANAYARGLSRRGGGGGGGGGKGLGLSAVGFAWCLKWRAWSQAVTVLIVVSCHHDGSVNSELTHTPKSICRLLKSPLALDTCARANNIGKLNKGNVFVQPFVVLNSS